MIESPMRICIIDVHQSYAEMLSAFLRDDEGQHRVELFRSWDDFERRVSGPPCDLCIVDPASANHGPLEFLKQLENRSARSGLVVLTAQWSPLLLHTALRVGVRGYLLKQEPVGELCGLLRNCWQNDCVLSNSLQKLVARNPESGVLELRTSHALAEFTDDQLSLVEHLADGASVKEIADRLDVSYKSVDSLKYRLMNRLGIKNRIQLVRLAIREGICRP